MLKAVGKTDIGNIREINQDDFNCGVLGEDAVFAVVCDGMGGEKGGHIASRTAADIVTHILCMRGTAEHIILPQRE